MNPFAAYDLTGRVAVITGAGSGIGRASANLLAAAGATVWCLDVDEAAATATAEAIAADGGTANARRVNVVEKAEVDAAIAAVTAEHGRLDVMGNIAGVIRNQILLDVSESDLDHLFGINLRGVFFGSQAAGRVMREQGSGSIINFASAAIDQPAPTVGVYAMTKAAVAMMTKTLAHEIAPVRVNAVAPGFTMSNMTNRHFMNPDGTEDPVRKAAIVQAMSASSPIKRAGLPEDQAHLVLYLAADVSSFMTGQILRANGGVQMPW